jgi:predicted acetyltransferase
MSVTLRDARDLHDDRAWILATYRDYLAELSASRSGLFPMRGEWPARDEELVSGWFRDPASQPFLILADGARAGFSLVGRRLAWPPGAAQFRMSEFFVVPAARRRGVGTRAALLLFSRFDGEWEVLENEENRAALAFWRRVIGSLTGGRYQETREAGEVRQRFRSAVRPPEPRA